MFDDGNWGERGKSEDMFDEESPRESRYQMSRCYRRLLTCPSGICTLSVCGCLMQLQQHLSLSPAYVGHAHGLSIGSCVCVWT